MSKLISKQLGVGVGYRSMLDGWIKANSAYIDVLEVFPEQFIKGGKVVDIPLLNALRQRYSLVLHGLTTNLVSASPPMPQYLKRVRDLLKITGSPYFSDHIAMTRTDGFGLGHLCPNRYNKEVLQTTLRNVQVLQATLEVPIVVEYITYTARLPGSEWTPEEFFLELVHSNEDLGILVDVTNVWYNSMSFEFDPTLFLDSLPSDRVVHVHLAGGAYHGTRWVDSHSSSVHPEVFQLLIHLCQSSRPETVIIERDSSLPEAREDLIPDLITARRILQGGDQLAI